MQPSRERGRFVIPIAHTLLVRTDQFLPLGTTTSWHGVVHDEADMCRIRLVGHLEAASSGRLHEALRGATQARATVWVDVSTVESMDTRTLRTLIRGRRRASALGGALVLVGPSQQMTRLLASTGLLGWFDVLDLQTHLDIGSRPSR